ncbi:hypothetical protein U3516DRAFT_273080 [Neocallimastix sp. 'constans']
MKFIKALTIACIALIGSALAWDDEDTARDEEELKVFKCSQKCQYLLTIPPRYEQWDPKECKKNEVECICSGGTDNGLLLCMSECVGIDCEEFVEMIKESDEQLGKHPIDEVKFDL